MATRFKSVIALLVTGAVVITAACAGAPAAPTPNIEATVDARVKQERAVDATVEARLAQERAVDATAEAKAKVEASLQAPTTDTPTLLPTATPTPVPTATPTPVPTDTPIPPTDTPPNALVSPEISTMPPIVNQRKLIDTKIAFNSNRDENLGIYVMNTDGSNQTRVSDNSAWDAEPSWSPDGKKIASKCSGDRTFQICVMNADGSGRTQLTNNKSGDQTASWSPDGKKIVFYTSYVSGGAVIWVMNSDGTGQTRLTDGSATDSDPSWSPDGTKIAFTSTRPWPYEIYVMNTDGSNQSRLTDGSAQDSEPSWSPDGTKIAFTSGRDGNGEIYVMNSDGSNQTRLTNNPGWDGSPSWSPYLPRNTVKEPSKKPTPIPTATRMPPTPTPSGSGIIAQWSGSSIKSTETFNVPTQQWKISWDTRPGDYGEMNFQILVYNADGTPYLQNFVVANVIGANKDSSVMRGSGRYYLTFNSAQLYDVTVTSLP